MTKNSDLVERFNRAKKDPVVVALRWSMRGVDLLFFGWPHDLLWDALCRLQDRRYLSLVPLD